jgi:lysophospholipase L1-like esterase
VIVRLGLLARGRRERATLSNTDGLRSSFPMGKTLRGLKGVMHYLQMSWSILGITLLMLLSVEGGFRVTFGIRDRLTAQPVVDPRVLAEGYAGATWPVDHYRELVFLQDRWEPYVYFRQKPFHGKTINIGDDGLRATWQPPAHANDRGQRGPVKILMLGGSSLWGYGARDDQTIPSLVGRSLDARGWHAEIKNLSEIGYVSTQELMALIRELQAGYRPDVVIFYDGVNDTTSAFLEGEAGVTTNEVNRRVEFNLRQSPARLAAALATELIQDSGSYRFAQMVRRRLGGAIEPARPQPKGEGIGALAEQVVRRYEANVTLAANLGNSFGFRPLFFWQPTIFDKPKLVSFEREEAYRFAWAQEMFRQVRSQIASSSQLKAATAFRDLSEVFADSDGLVYIDYCHITELANARIASLMADRVIEIIERAAPSGRNRVPQGGGPAPQ